MHTLCDECFNVCVDKSQEFRDRYPAWIWKTFTEKIQSRFFGSTTLSELYGEELWRIVPVTMRPWWIESVRCINHFGDFPFRNVTVSEPPSYFVDRTVEFGKYHDAMNSDKFGGFLGGMRNQNINLPNVYCPFQCTEHPANCKHANWDVIIQHALKRTPITLGHTNRYGNLHNFDCMHDGYFRKNDDYDCILLNPEWRIMPTLVIDVEKGPVILTCSQHGNGSDLLKLYPPRPIHHNLCSRQTDQLAAITIKPRTIRPTQRKAYCTTFSMTEMKGSFSGVDTCWISTHSNWGRLCPLLSDHEARSLAGRPDMMHLLQKKVDAQQLPAAFADTIRENATEKYSSIDLRPYIDGATYIPLEYVYKIQIARTTEAKNGNNITAINDKKKKLAAVDLGHVYPTY